MNIYLIKMTKALARQYFKDFTNDPDVYQDANKFTAYAYSDAASDAYWERQQNLGRLHFAVMLDSDPIGETILKNIDPKRCSCTLSIHLKNDSVKNKGYGTVAEILTLQFAFNELGMKTVYADALDKNVRSRRVLEKAGFSEIHSDGVYHYYRCDKNRWIQSADGPGPSSDF